MSLLVSFRIASPQELTLSDRFITSAIKYSSLSSSHGVAPTRSDCAWNMDTCTVSCHVAKALRATAASRRLRMRWVPCTQTKIVFSKLSRKSGLRQRTANESTARSHLCQEEYEFRSVGEFDSISPQLLTPWLPLRTDFLSA